MNINNLPFIVVTGANGQLGYELHQLSKFFPQYHWLFTNRQQLDLSDNSSIKKFFQEYKPNYFINAAAYTAVDKAETEKELAYQINAKAVGHIAENCKHIDCKFITISTDYVFDGKGTKPYVTTEKTNPVNYYGYTKQQGEELAIKYNEDSIIIRTSWVYSVHGNNFVKTMKRIMTERLEINVVADQTGAPTYAANLAEAIITIINAKHGKGIYHYSDLGAITWYDFAVEIGKLIKTNCQIHPIPSSAFPTPAKRPSYSLMDCAKIVSDFNLEQKYWQVSLQTCLSLLNK